MVHTSLSISLAKTKLTRMRVHFFRCHWPSNFIGLRYHMPDLRCKCEEDRTKTMDDIVDEP